MSFQNLKVDELKEVAEFFAVEVTQADNDKPATKKELVAALASGDNPVTWEDYNEVFLKAKESGNDKAPEVKAEEEQTKEDEAEKKVEPVVEEQTKEDEAEKKVEPVVEEDTSGYVLVKYDRKNPSYEVGGVTFTRAHPFASVKPDLAEFLVRNVKGFRPAMPSEVSDYYN